MDGESSKRIKLESILHDQRLHLNLYSFSLKDLREITNDFSHERLLGQGAFGRVYKGLLQNGDIIAVKKLISTMPGLEDKQYENEARHLMRLIHPNIVQLVGYCSETEKELVLYHGKYVYAEKSERLLCLEYLPNGSLRNHISDASSGLDWYTRYKIIAGICCGLHYLHEEWQPSTPIVHRDLKPANILLDDNMVPKIADFGLSRLFDEEQTRTTTKNFNGTLGYMAPEYLNRGIITKELDIFSFGVIIIQIVTGEKHYPYKEETSSSQEFIDLVLKKWRNRLGKVPGYTSQEFDCRQIRRCIEIGLLCVKSDRAERPTTRRIIEMLASEDAECGTEREGRLEHVGSSRTADQNTRNVLKKRHPQKKRRFSPATCVQMPAGAASAGKPEHNQDTNSHSLKQQSLAAGLTAKTTEGLPALAAGPQGSRATAPFCFFPLAPASGHPATEKGSLFSSPSEVVKLPNFYKECEEIVSALMVAGRPDKQTAPADLQGSSTTAPFGFFPLLATDERSLFSISSPSEVDKLLSWLPPAGRPDKQLAPAVDIPRRPATSHSSTRL